MTAALEESAGRLLGRVGADHTRRKAVVYVRQSTPGQVERHGESTRIQYGLTDRARLLGWADVDIQVVDDDLGCSAREAGTRSGFSGLVADIVLGEVGIVIVSEVSRLARNLSEWGGLLDFCSRADTLIADAETLYDLKRPNDRFLLGIRGTMSEAELHTLRQRMHAGREAKAARGELAALLPRGYVRDEQGRTVKDPDASVRARIEGVFAMFRQHGSLSGTLRAMAADGQGFPVRRARGPRRGQLEWPEPTSASLYDMLTSPVYAGAFAWGRAKDLVSELPVEERWRHLVKDAHPAYIGWEEFELNQRQLADNRWPVRSRGGGLLSGLLRCGRCGQGMTVHYRLGSDDGAGYKCRGRRDCGDRKCQALPGLPVDSFVSSAAVEALSPAAVDISLKAIDAAEGDRAGEHERWRLRLERADLDVAACERAWRSVDCGNRLVAQSLEDQWEEALAERRRLGDSYGRHCRRLPARLTPEERDGIRRSASGISGLWDGGRLETPEKAELLRLMIDRVTATVIDDSERVAVEILWHGGSRTRAEIRRPVREASQLSYCAELCARIRALKEEGRNHAEIAGILNGEGLQPPRKSRFNAGTVTGLVERIGAGRRAIKRGRSVPAERGPDEWTVDEMADRTGVCKPTLYKWIYDGRICARKAASQSKGRSRPRIWLIHAASDTFEAIRKWRETPKPEKDGRPMPDFRIASETDLQTL